MAAPRLAAAKLSSQPPSEKLAAPTAPDSSLAGAPVASELLLSPPPSKDCMPAAAAAIAAEADTSTAAVESMDPKQPDKEAGTTPSGGGVKATSAAAADERASNAKAAQLAQAASEVERGQPASRGVGGGGERHAAADAGRAGVDARVEEEACRADAARAEGSQAEQPATGKTDAQKAGEAGTNRTVPACAEAEAVMREAHNGDSASVERAQPGALATDKTAAVTETADSASAERRQAEQTAPGKAEAKARMQSVGPGRRPGKVPAAGKQEAVTDPQKTDSPSLSIWLVPNAGKSQTQKAVAQAEVPEAPKAGPCMDSDQEKAASLVQGAGGKQSSSSRAGHALLLTTAAAAAADAASEDQQAENSSMTAGQHTETALRSWSHLPLVSVEADGKSAPVLAGALHWQSDLIVSLPGIGFCSEAICWMGGRCLGCSRQQSAAVPFHRVSLPICWSRFVIHIHLPLICHPHVIHCPPSSSTRHPSSIFQKPAIHFSNTCRPSVIHLPPMSHANPFLLTPTTPMAVLPLATFPSAIPQISLPAHQPSSTATHQAHEHIKHNHQHLYPLHVCHL